jgi:outer membrane receptor protein involved in Fe transport
MLDLFGDVLMGYTANPDLIPEISNNFDAGVSSFFFHNKLTIQFGSYYSNIKNLINSVKETATTYKIINLKSAVFAGGEFMLKYSPSDKAFALISYSYLNAKNTSDNRTSDFIAYRPKNQLKTFLSYTPLHYLGFDLTYTGVSKRNFDNQTIWNEVPGYSTFDFGISSNLGNYFTFWLKVNNLFDKNFVSSFDQPQPGREFRLGLSYNFKVAGHQQKILFHK